jgi:hypothetical protein
MNQTVAKIGPAHALDVPANLAGMRLHRLLVLSAAASVLVAGCASEGREAVVTSAPTLTPSSARPSATTTTTTTTPARSPAAGAAMQDVIRWVEAAKAADPDGFHTVTRDGVTTDIGDGVAFTTTDAQCVTNRYRAGAPACLVALADPPPRPDGIEGMWKGNWVDYTGTTLEVGSAHGDPGPFGDGTGAALPVGSSLAFGDYRCRSDADGLLCVNYAHQSAVRLAAAGVQPFGCLQKAAAPPGIGEQYGC